MIQDKSDKNIQLDPWSVIDSLWFLLDCAGLWVVLDQGILD